jgi:hypothetical protein
MDSMDVLTALYELKDKSDSLGEDDKAFVLETIAAHESGKRQLNRHEILRIADLHDSTRGVRAACAHQLQAPVFTESGQPTDEYECALCHRRFKTPGPTFDEL